jgi:Zn-finger nucleic acid-binding protein
MSERGGVEIDYCPQCRGVWLDRGELDKIIDRAADSMVSPAPAPPPHGLVPPPLYGASRSDERRDRPRYEEPRYDKKRFDDRRRPKKKEGWLGELFDF